MEPSFHEKKVEKSLKKSWESAGEREFSDDSLQIFTKSLFPPKIPRGCKFSANSLEIFSALENLDMQRTTMMFKSFVKCVLKNKTVEGK